MILHLVEHVTEIQVTWPLPEGDISNVLRKLMEVRRVLADVPPHDDLARLLIHSQGRQYEHDVLDVISEMLDRKLVIVKQVAVASGEYVKLKPVDI